MRFLKSVLFVEHDFVGSRSEDERLFLSECFLNVVGQRAGGVPQFARIVITIFSPPCRGLLIK